MSDLLTIGMATRGEFDSVWFTLTGLTSNHPKVRYLVVDNTPERCPRTEAITKASGGTYIHRPDLSGTSKPRDAVFRYATTDWVMCIDSHLILETGAVQSALDYAAAHPNSRDLVQGPMVYDDGRGLSTHWNQPAPPGLWGTWDRDGRVEGDEPFDIPMMGLGLWMMRRSEWPGFNPLFNWFGGEEGYLHEVVRRRGGRCLCLPQLRWRHKFRDISGWDKNPAPPYPLRLEDHVWNLLVGHREVGIDAVPQIHNHFGKRLSADQWKALVEKSEQVQPFGGSRPDVKRQKLLAIWYSDSKPSPVLLKNSAQSVMDARQQTQRHDVMVSAVSWEPIAGDPFNHPSGKWERFEGDRKRSHATIVAQIKQAVESGQSRWWSYDEKAGWVLGEFDAVVFCEHDVLYPPNYFDRIGDALASNPGAPVVSNLDYIGLNGTGWQKVRERHEPLHQLTLRWDTFRQNIARAESEASDGRQVILEPDHDADRSKWVRLPVSKGEVQMPAVHINHNSRFTSHGDVCYEPVGYSLNHPFWGEAKRWWPAQMTTVANLNTKSFKQETKQVGCAACEADRYGSLDNWYAAAAGNASDFNEHVPTLKELASKCEHVTELSLWGKPADVAVASGLSEKGRFTSVSKRLKPQWKHLTKYLGERFKGVQSDPAATDLEPTDLLFVDTEHDAETLLALLNRHHKQVRKYIVVHCTQTFGQTGDQVDGDGKAKAGVMVALQQFLSQHLEWGVVRHDTNNHGLMVLSVVEEDRKALPSFFKQAGNFLTAVTKHAKAGFPLVALPVFEERMSHCAVCPERSFNRCAACGCPLEKKLQFATESCGLTKKGLEPKWGPVELAVV